MTTHRQGTAYPPEVRAAIVATYVSGQTISQTARTHKVGRNTVDRIIRAARVTRKRGPVPAKPKPKRAPVVPCRAEGCTKPARQRGFCMRDYNRAQAGLIPDPDDAWTGEWVQDGLIVRPSGLKLDLGRRVP